MGMRQMTFEIPDEVADRFISEVPASEQSAEVAKLLLRRVSRRTLTEEQWNEACEAANEFDDAADDAWLAEMAKASGGLESLNESETTADLPG